MKSTIHFLGIEPIVASNKKKLVRRFCATSYISKGYSRDPASTVQTGGIKTRFPLRKTGYNSPYYSYLNGQNGYDLNMGDGYQNRMGPGVCYTCV